MILADKQVKVDSRTFFFSLLILLAVCRGGLELLMAKKLAMTLQFGSVIALCTVLFFPINKNLSSSQKYFVLFSLLFIAEAFLSCLLTFTLHNTTIWIVYFAFNLGLLWMGLFTIRKFERKELTFDPAPALLFAGWLLLSFAALEQFNLIKFDATGEIYIVRPASLTGSFLHYPIIMALIGIACIQWGALSKKKLYLFSGFLFIISPVISASRSGTLIVLATILFYPLTAPLKKSKKMILCAVLLIACGLSSLALFSKESKKSPLHNLAYHIVMAASKKSIGNNIRFRIWDHVISEWLGSNLLIGEEAGKYTNASNNISAKKKFDTNKSRVAESSVLQLLSNFGLIGMLLFYAILFQVYRYINPGHYWMKAAFLAALFQTLFYQSIEVVPFMTLLFLFPFISQSYKKELDNISCHA